MECISKVVKLQETHLPKVSQEAYFWKGFVYYYYLHSKRQLPGTKPFPTNRQPDHCRLISQIIKSCETALLAVNDSKLKISAKYILVKLGLFVQKEKFGCGLFYVTQNDVKLYIKDIQKSDDYIGTLALCESYIDGKENNRALAISTVEGLTKKYPARSEAYIKLWQIYMSMGKEFEDASKQT